MLRVSRSRKTTRPIRITIPAWPGRRPTGLTKNPANGLLPLLGSAQPAGWLERRRYKNERTTFQLRYAHRAVTKPSTELIGDLLVNKTTNWISRPNPSADGSGVPGVSAEDLAGALRELGGVLGREPINEIGVACEI
jgi:hypothetical protein